MSAFPDIPAPQRWEQPGERGLIHCGRARLYGHACSRAAVLRIEGEIDASNAKLVGQAVRHFSGSNTPLILDLSHLDFLGVVGFRSLLVLDEEYRRGQLLYTVVSGPALRQLTRVFGDQGLPIVDSVIEGLQDIDEAVASVTATPRPRVPGRNPH